MEALRLYLNSLSGDEQQRYAERCGTSVGYLRKALSIGQKLGESLAISLDRESGGQVPCEKLRPDVDWAYLKHRSFSRSEQRALP